MDTSPDNVTTTWRDIADQLTVQERDRLAVMEIGLGPADGRLLRMARRYASVNVCTSVYFGHLDQPEGAVHILAPQQTTTGDWYRPFIGAERYPGGLCTVVVYGTQLNDGMVHRSVQISFQDPDEPGDENQYWLAADEARDLAAALIDMADEIDGLTAASGSAGTAAI